MTVKEQPIAVIGAGSWGTALAMVLAENGNAVRLWDHNDDQVEAMKRDRENQRYLPGISLPENLHITSTLSEAVDQVEDVLLVVPSNAFYAVIEQLKQVATCKLRIAWGTKGLDGKTGYLLHQVVYDVLGDTTPIALLSGPSFAKEVARKLPTAVVLAGTHTEFTQTMIDRLHNNHFRIYENRDIVGVELCGVVKNVLAIAVGISDGMQFGANARSALITRGLAEMSRLCKALGGRRETVSGLAGLGDLILTCTDDQSRNRRYGYAIGQGQSHGDTVKAIDQVVEGYDNTQHVMKLAEHLKVDMPVTQQVYQVICQDSPADEAMKSLLGRPQKME